MRTDRALHPEPEPDTIPGRDRTCRALGGWSPPDLPPDTTAKRWVDRVMPRAGSPTVLYFVAVIALLALAPHLPQRMMLAVDGLAALAGGSWCGVNFWRCRHAHCVVTSAGWLALGVFAFTEAGLGHSLIGGAEQPVFLGVLLIGLAFEGYWYVTRRTNAVVGRTSREDDRPDRTDCC